MIRRRVLTTYLKEALLRRVLRKRLLRVSVWTEVLHRALVFWGATDLSHSLQNP